MKARKLILIVVIALMVMIFSFSATQANTISLYDSGDRYSNGGPFIANVMENTPDGLVGDPITGGIQFTTFCLEKTEYFYAWGTPYSYTIASYAVGGSGGAVAGQDSLDPMSAYLYYNFRMNPSAYNQKALQAAFWHIEDEQYLPESPDDGSIEATAWNYVNAATDAGWTTIGPVVVLNLYDGEDNLQSQLGLMVPEPMTIILLGFGLLGLGLARRKS